MFLMFLEICFYFIYFPYENAHEAEFSLLIIIKLNYMLKIHKNIYLKLFIICEKHLFRYSRTLM